MGRRQYLTGALARGFLSGCQNYLVKYLGMIKFGAAGLASAVRALAFTTCC